MKLFEKLSDSERKALQNGVIEVHGKSMNRTALGVVDAMLQLYPNATFEELKTMLPDSINPAAPKNYKSLFKPYTDKMYGVIQPGSIRKECEENELDINASHFTGDKEIFKTSDGIEVLVSKSWESKDTETGEHDLENLINHVGQYGIRVVSFESNKPFKKGEYLIEIINPGLVHRIQNPRTKKFPWWILLLLLTLFGVALFFILHKSSINETAEPIPTTPQSKVTVIIEDKPTITELKSQIKSGINTEGESLSFHEILFKKGGDVILPESEAYLLEILSFLNDIPELTLLIVGHTSIEGDFNFNTSLSKKRAASVVNYLISKGIASSRLTQDGKGSSEPVETNENEEGKKLNRRIEFIITNDGGKEN